jgi:hypothetical protein
MRSIPEQADDVPAHPGGLIATRVWFGNEPSYEALVDPSDRWNGHVSPRFTLDTVRQLAANTQANAAKYGHNSTDTIHVIDGGTTDEGEPQVIVLHIRWPHYEADPEGGASVVPRGEDGRYVIGSWEWAWRMVDQD